MAPRRPRRPTDLLPSAGAQKAIVTFSRVSDPGRGLSRFLFALAGLLQVLCPLLFFTDLTLNPYLIQIALLRTGVYVAVLGVVWWGLRRGRVPWTGTALDTPLVVFAAAGLIGWALAWATHPSLRGAIASEGLKGAIFLWVNALGVFFFSTRLAGGEGREFLRRLTLGVGALSAAYALLQYAGVDPLWPEDLNPFHGRPVSTYGNPNFLSTALALLLPVALEEMLSARTRRGALWAGGGALLFTAAIVSTTTRSSYVGAAAGLAAVFFLCGPAVRARPGRAVLWGAAALALIVLWPAARLSPETLSPLTRVVDLWRGMTGETVYASWHQRLLIWSSAGDLWRSRPLWGQGWGLFELFFPFFQGRYLSDEVFRLFRTHANNAHQLVLEVGAQMGGVGVGLLVWVGVIAVMAHRRARGLSPRERSRAGALAAGLGAAVTDNFFGNVSLFFAVPAFLFFWNGGQWAALVSGRASCWEARGPWRRGGLLLLAGLALFGVAREIQVFRAAVWHLAGVKAVQAGDLRAAEAALTRSRRLNEHEVQSLFELGNVQARQARWAQERGLSGEAAARFEQALSAYDGALAANAGYDEIYFNRAGVRQERGRDDAAADDWRVSLLLNPWNREAYRCLGRLYLANPATPRARELFERAVFYFPREKEFWEVLGFLRERGGDSPAARRAYERAVRLDLGSAAGWAALRRLTPPGERPPLFDAPARVARVREAVRRGRWADARREAEALSRDIPENALACLMAADVAARAEDWAPAERAYRLFLQWEPAHRDARLNLAHLLASTGRAAEARALLESLRRERPGDADVEKRLAALGGTVPSTRSPI